MYTANAKGHCRACGRAHAPQSTQCTETDSSRHESTKNFLGYKTPLRVPPSADPTHRDTEPTQFEFARRIAETRLHTLDSLPRSTVYAASHFESYVLLFLLAALKTSLIGLRLGNGNSYDLS